MLTLISIGDINYGAYISWPENFFTLQHTDTDNNSPQSLALYALALAIALALKSSIV